MFIKKSTHEKIVEDLHYFYSRTEHYLEKEIEKLRHENENLKRRLDKASGSQPAPRPSRSESIARKINSYSAPSRVENEDASVLTTMVLLNSLSVNTCTQDNSHNPICEYSGSSFSYSGDSSSFSSNDSSSFSSNDSSSFSCDY